MSRPNLELVRSSSEAIFRDVLDGRVFTMTGELLGELLGKARFSGPEAAGHVPIWDRGHIVGAMTQAAADKIVSGRAKHSISGSFTRPEENADNKAHTLDLYPVAAEPEKPKAESAEIVLRFRVDCSEVARSIEREFAGIKFIEDPTLEPGQFRVGPGAPRR